MAGSCGHVSMLHPCSDDATNPWRLLSASVCIIGVSSLLFFFFYRGYGFSKASSSTSTSTSTALQKTADLKPFRDMPLDVIGYMLDFLHPHCKYLILPEFYRSSLAPARFSIGTIDQLYIEEFRSILITYLSRKSSYESLCVVSARYSL